ncbi:hypothetical protein [Streptomyces sp. NPDC059378]|uniref:hypothetical protein n=1 Tax=Streptomyces sp. NPDC059378 TaxID=3346815 RepID=UPI00369DD471
MPWNLSGTSARVILRPESLPGWPWRWLDSGSVSSDQALKFGGVAVILFATTLDVRPSHCVSPGQVWEDVPDVSWIDHASLYEEANQLKLLQQI